MNVRSKRSKAAKARQAKIALRIVFISFLILTISPLAACTPPAIADSAIPRTGQEPTALPELNAVATSLTFIAEADAQVNESDPEANFGDSTFLQVDGATDPGVESFIRFTVTGISDTVQSVRLRVYDTTNDSDNGPAVYATEPTWNESRITWSSRPARVSGELDNKDAITTNTWVEYDVTSIVTGNGTFSFVLAADSKNATTFSSRQGSEPPQLVVTLADGPTPTSAPPATVAATLTPPPTSTQGPPGTSLIFIPEADAQVEESNPDQNYGNAATLEADNESDPDIESFIRFTVTGVSGMVQGARLRLYTTSNGSKNSPAVYSTDPAWAEAEITWNTRPARTSDVIDNKDLVDTENWVEYDVTSVVTGDGTFSFVLAADSSDAITFSSRQGSNAPQLVMLLNGALASPTPLTGDPVLVGAGDISVCTNDNDELTAQLLDNIPGTVFTTGDNAYSDGTFEQFTDCYGPTWGRHKDRTQPVPGNHDYHTSGAAGYFQYFDNIPSYYTYDLGTWRIYALNSEIDVSAGSLQATWLQLDLAANPRQCVLAYWHRPRWSSGDHHGSNPDLQTLWQILYESGAELVLNGHEHNYERFAPMNAAGAADPLGLREFVVGTGGRNLYEIGDVLPVSEAHDSATYGVLKLTLRAAGYDWQFVPVAGSTFTDGGSSECH